MPSEHRHRGGRQREVYAPVADGTIGEISVIMCYLLQAISSLLLCGVPLQNLRDGCSRTPPQITYKSMGRMTDGHYVGEILCSVSHEPYATRFLLHGIGLADDRWWMQEYCAEV